MDVAMKNGQEPMARNEEVNRKVGKLLAHRLQIAQRRLQECLVGSSGKR
jgi:hypothetical protein